MSWPQPSTILSTWGSADACASRLHRSPQRHHRRHGSCSTCIIQLIASPARQRWWLLLPLRHSRSQQAVGWC